MVDSVFSESNFSLEDEVKARISPDDIKLFNSSEGIWFEDDNGKLVQAILDMNFREKRTILPPKRKGN